MAKALLTFEKLETVISEIGCSLNFKLVTYLDEHLNNNILTPNHLIYGYKNNQ